MSLIFPLSFYTFVDAAREKTTTFSLRAVLPTLAKHINCAILADRGISDLWLWITENDCG